MRKYRIMIVDDEEEVRLGVLKRIDWDSLGYEVAADAENGQDALDKAEGLELDVVMTDIKMPYMDGLEFADRLQQQQPGVKLIILSGFNEFEYAKRAIKLNVVEYVLKPVNAQELSEILARVRRTLDEETAEHRNAIRLMESYEQSLPLLRDKFFDTLISGSASNEEIASGCAEYGIRLDGNPYKAVMSFLPGSSGAAIENKLVPFSLRDIICECLEGKCIFETLLRFPAVSAIVSFEQRNYNALMSLAAEICGEAKRALGCEITAGVSSFCRELSDLPDAASSARVALDYRAIVGGPVVSIRDVERSENALPVTGGAEKSALARAVRFGTPESIEAAVKNELDSLPDQSADPIGYAEKALLLASEVLRIARQYPEGAKSIALPEIDAGRDRLYAWLTAECGRLSGLISDTRVSGAAKMVEQALRQINERYSDPALSVESMCESLHISASYFSSLFKRETGKSFVQYLIDLRLEKAIELLKTTDLRTYEIAEAVGYNEPNYFSYVFKKKYGAPPSQFRKN